MNKFILSIKEHENRCSAHVRCLKRRFISCLIDQSALEADNRNEYYLRRAWALECLWNIGSARSLAQFQRASFRFNHGGFGLLITDCYSVLKSKKPVQWVLYYTEKGKKFKVEHKIQLIFRHTHIRDLRESKHYVLAVLESDIRMWFGSLYI